jgi:ribosomal protein S27E
MDATSWLLLLGAVGGLPIFFGVLFILGNEDPDKQRQRFAESAYLAPGEEIQAIFRAVFYLIHDYRSGNRPAKTVVFVVTNRSIMVQNLLLGRWQTRELPDRHPRNFYFGTQTARGGGRARVAFTLGDIKYYVDPKFVGDVAAADRALAEMNRSPRGRPAGMKDGLPTVPQGKPSKIKCQHCQHIQVVPTSQQTFACEECGTKLKRRAKPANGGQPS